MNGSAQPIWLWIDPTRRCNLECELCYTKPSHGADELEPASLRDYLDRLVRSPSIVPQELTLNWRGEPLMNKRFPELLAVVRDSGLRCPVQFHTNAMLLTPRVAQAIVDAAGPLRIFVSIDGGNESSHDGNRGTGSFRRALRGAWNLLAARGQRRNPAVILYQLDLCEPLEHHDPEFLELAEAVDDHQRVLPVLPGGTDNDHRETTMVSEGLRASPAQGGLLTLRVSPRGPCFWAGNSLSIAPDGDVSICILSNRDDGVIGNLEHDSVEVLMARANEWRARLSRVGRPQVVHCRHCCKREGTARPSLALDAPQPTAEVS